ncbi:hypothetical protein V8B97DRAFT_1915528 [Scleroderma yunnanense]
MFSQLSAFIAASFAVLAIANPVDLEARGNSCYSGSAYCCTSSQYASSSEVGQVLGWLGIPIPSSNTLVGFTCSPITVGGTGTGPPTKVGSAFTDSDSSTCFGNTHLRDLKCYAALSHIGTAGVVEGVLKTFPLWTDKGDFDHFQHVQALGKENETMGIVFYSALKYGVQDREAALEKSAESTSERDLETVSRHSIPASIDRGFKMWCLCIALVVTFMMVMALLDFPPALLDSIPGRTSISAVFAPSRVIILNLSLYQFQHSEACWWILSSYHELTGRPEMVLMCATGLTTIAVLGGVVRFKNVAKRPINVTAVEPLPLPSYLGTEMLCTAQLCAFGLIRMQAVPLRE